MDNTPMTDTQDPPLDNTPMTNPLDEIKVSTPSEIQALFSAVTEIQAQMLALTENQVQLLTLIDTLYTPRVAFVISLASKMEVEFAYAIVQNSSGLRMATKAYIESVHTLCEPALNNYDFGNPEEKSLYKQDLVTFKNFAERAFSKVYNIYLNISESKQVRAWMMIANQIQNLVCLALLRFNRVTGNKRSIT